MSFIGGYQSNFNFNALQLVGDIPIDHTLGGYGVASGINAYILNLNPAITGYRAGLPLEVMFTHPNGGPSTLDVDGNGPKSIKKIVNGALADLDVGDLGIYKVYILIYDGVYFQLANHYEGGALLLPPDATEDLRGIAQIATTAEINAGADNSKIVTPAKLAAYVANKLTGLWEDKGLIDCSTNPNYPAGQVGDAYTVSVAGKIGGIDGDAVAVRAIIYCNVNNAGGTKLAVGNDWTIIQSTTEQATEVIVGMARIALQAEVNTGTDNATIVSPLKLKTLLDNRLATETVSGLAELATQVEVNAGVDDSRIVTPLKLITFLANLHSSEILSGLIELATQAEVNAGVDDLRAVTPLKLLSLLNTLLQYKPGGAPGAIIPYNGVQNAASANFATVLNGQNNTAAGPYSMATGQLANAILYGEFARSGGGFYNTTGSAQHSVISLFNIIPAAALAYPLTLDGNGVSAANRWRVPLRSIQHFTAMVTIVQNSGTTGQAGDSWTGIFEGAVKNSIGNATWIGGDPTLRDTRQDPGFFPTIQFLPNGDEIVIAVDGMIERSLHAMVTIFITQTKFALS
ncbi:MAG: hypothetical protein JST26_05485 [Bacteroidetes bacterium]|nr:hypothetical protein [Bacteroidota bacterium]